MSPYYDADGITIYHGDCREVLPTLDRPDLLLTDPPYGLDGASHQGGGRTFDWREVAMWDADTVDSVPALATAAEFVVIWGGNYYALPPARCWLLWDKKQNDQWTGAQAEMAWTNLERPVRMFRLSTISAYSGMDKVHPTQKPEALFSWCISMVRADITSLVDPFMGSGTALRVAKDRGIRAIGIELDERYCEIAAKRLNQGVLNFGGVA